jgi:imidazolonepropionase
MPSTQPKPPDGGPFTLLVRGASAVLTADGPEDADSGLTLGALPGAAVGVRGAEVAWIGQESALPAGALGPGTEVVDANGGLVTPGFVDCHSHAVYAGDRSAEFALRALDVDAAGITRAGGGILSTVLATRAQDEESLVRLALPRLQRLLAQGVTTLEVKSGYGLTPEDELKMLRVIRRLGFLQPIRLLPTFLWLHALPPEWTSDRAGYLTLGLRTLATVVREGLAEFADAFVEQGAFTPAEARAFLGEAKAAGLKPRLHVDQLSAGRGAELAAELGATSADHLECVSVEGIQALARAQVTAVLVPVATLVLRRPKYAPGKALREAGVRVALASNVNPGSAPTENLALSLGLACLLNGLTPEEALLGVTRWGGQALGRTEAGRLRVGGPADLLVLGCREVAHLAAHLGVAHAQVVVKAGRVVLRASDAARCT